MVDAIISPLLEKLISFVHEETKERVKLVTGVEKEVKKLTSNLQAIQAVLEDAELRQLTDKTIGLWLDQLKDASYYMEDVLDEWITARLKLQIEGANDHQDALAPRKKACSCFGGFKQLRLRRDIAVKIKAINEMLDEISTQKDKFQLIDKARDIVKKYERLRTTSLIDENEICGRVEERNQLLSKLLCEVSQSQKGHHMISIVGLGGIGKTTLAQLACNDDEVKRKFDKVIWVCVSDKFNQITLAKAIIEALDKSATSLNEFQSLMLHIRHSIKGKKFFLVLDDVWDGDYNKWEPFFHCLKNGVNENRILITTRNESVARMMGSTDIISVKELAEEECWTLFKQVAFLDRSIDECDELEQIGRKIASNCKGLPLAAKTIASLLRSKGTAEEWERILGSEIWKVEEIEKGILPTLLLSYNDLPSAVKRCFSYCAVFPKDYNIKKEELITLWMAQDYLNAEDDAEAEMVGEDYFNILATRSLFQEFKKDDDGGRIISCKMHDIVHDFARFLSKSECLSTEAVTCSFGEKVHHVLLTRQGSSFPISIGKANRLRSLIVLTHGANEQNSLLNGVEIFHELTCLRALDIRNLFFWESPSPSLITRIPENIEKLVHLRYLNLSGQKMQRLPETLCNLCNLKKLDISECEKLVELPQGIGKLMNLKSLLNAGTESLKYLPVGIARLAGLQKLHNFPVGGVAGDESRSSSCRLESLENLKQLRECGLNRLRNVPDVGEAERSQLCKMEKLRRLGLSFQFDDEEEDEEEEEEEEAKKKDERVLEALKPPAILKDLEIESYRGDIFPKWLISLTNLKYLKLYLCIISKHLPPLGTLPSLEKLVISDLKSVRRIGNEFLGITSDDDDDDDDDSNNNVPVVAFPKLKSLEIRKMNELEEWEWDCRITKKGNTSIMPRLSSLEIGNCPKLKLLPCYLLQSSTLLKLDIRRCPVLEDCHEISLIRGIIINSSSMNSYT